MMRWLRVVLPPGMLVVLIIMYAFCEAPVLFLEWRFGQRFSSDRPSLAVLVFACVAYAVYRVVYFHPFFNKPYGRWLQSTPWTSQKQLPLGPIQLVWQDAVVLLVITGLGLQQVSLHTLAFLVIFLFAYLTLLGSTLRPAGLWGFAYATAFGLGLIVRLARLPVASAWAAVLLYPVGYVGLRLWLGRFQRGLSEPEFPHTVSVPGVTRAGVTKALGWPFDYLQPRRPTWMGFQTRDAILMSLLGGWWLYVGSSLPSDPIERRQAAMMVHLLLVLGLFSGRLLIYCVGYSAPISLWGRIRTFRWLMPGYDQVFVAPLIILLVGGLLPMLLWWQGLDPLLVMPPSTTLALLATLTIRPSLFEWRLTGHHRMTPVMQQGQFLKVG